MASRSDDGVSPSARKIRYIYFKVIKIIQYLKAQDKVKLILYILAFPIYVGINNLIFNIVIYLDAGQFYFNDVEYFAYPCSIVNTKTILLFSVLLKLTLFGLMFFIGKKEKLKYLTETLIIYFLFDFGQIGSMMLCDIINSFLGRVKFDGAWFFDSNFELIFTQFHLNVYITCLIWSFGLGIFILKNKRFSFDYFTKRFLIMPFSGLLYTFTFYNYSWF